MAQPPAASKLISQRIVDFGGWRGEALHLSEGETVDAAAFKALDREAVALNTSKTKPKPNRSRRNRSADREY